MNKAKDSKIHAIFKRVDRLMLDACCAEDKASQTALLKQARAQLSTALEGYPDNADLHHLMGLCWYEDPNDTDERKEQTKIYFNNALQLDSEHQFANLFLGHCHFDEGNYEQAQRHFLKVDADYFEQLDQSYRNLKNSELILCCRMYLNLHDVTSAEVESLFIYFDKIGDIDAPLPKELLTCVTKLFMTNPHKIRPWALRLIKMIYSLSFDKAKSLQKDLHFLQNALNSK